MCADRKTARKKYRSFEVCNKSGLFPETGLVTLISEVRVIPILVKWVIKILGQEIQDGMYRLGVRGLFKNGERI